MTSSNNYKYKNRKSWKTPKDKEKGKHHAAYYTKNMDIEIFVEKDLLRIEKKLSKISEKYFWIFW